MRTIRIPETVTYRALDDTLKYLGFTRSDVVQEKAIIYRHNDSGASVILPLRSATDEVSHLDLNMVRKTVVEKGVATNEGYAVAARKAFQVPIQRDGKPVMLELHFERTVPYSYESYNSVLSDVLSFGRVVLQRSYQRAVLEGLSEIDTELLHRMFDSLQLNDLTLNFDESIEIIKQYALKQNLMEMDTAVGPGMEVRIEYLRLPGWEIGLSDSGRKFMEELLEQDFRMHDRLIQDATLYLQERKY